jgi:hypothetical protein
MRAHKKHKPETDIAENRNVPNSVGKSPEAAVRQSKSITNQRSKVFAQHAKSTSGLSQAQKNKRKVAVKQVTLSRPKSPATSEPKSHGFFEELFDNN